MSLLFDRQVVTSPHWRSLVLHRCQNITYPLNLPQVSIVFIFVNEALSVILRSIHSAINRTPSHLLKEIILVDDNSNNSKLPVFDAAGFSLTTLTVPELSAAT